VKKSRKEENERQRERKRKKQGEGREDEKEGGGRREAKKKGRRGRDGREKKQKKRRRQNAVHSSYNLKTDLAHFLNSAVCWKFILKGRVGTGNTRIYLVILQTTHTPTFSWLAAF
jgi:hypothetical protein